MRTIDLYPEAWLAVMLALAALVGVIVALVVLASPVAARPRHARALRLLAVPHLWVCPDVPGGGPVVGLDVCISLDGMPIRRG